VNYKNTFWWQLPILTLNVPAAIELICELTTLSFSYSLNDLTVVIEALIWWICRLAEYAASEK